MKKSKVVQAIIFSGILILLIVLGAVYASGAKGEVLTGSVLSSEGQLGAGLISVSILVWFWVGAILLPTFTKWKGKSHFLTTILVSTFVAMPVAFVGGIIYVSKGKHEEENVTIITKKEGE